MYLVHNNSTTHPHVLHARTQLLSAYSLCNVRSYAPYCTVRVVTCTVTVTVEISRTLGTAQVPPHTIQWGKKGHSINETILPHRSPCFHDMT